MQENCPNAAYNTFIQLYKEAFETSFPLKQIKPNKKFIRRDPWITPALLVSSRTKAKLLEKKLCKPTNANIDRYKKYVNMYNLIKRLTKASYYKDILNENKSDMKKTWSILRQAIGKTNDKSNFRQSFLIDHELQIISTNTFKMLE